MHNYHFKLEKLYLAAFVIVALIIGAITTYWLLSLLVCSLVYIAWKWIEFYYFYQWYKNGAQHTKLPLNHGVWEDFASLVLNNKNKNRKISKRNKLLLNQFDRTAKALPYATIILNKKHQITWVNPISYEILGVNLEDKGLIITNIVRDSVFIKLLNHEHGTSDITMNHPHDKLRKIHVKLVKLSNKRFLVVARDISQQDALRKSRKAFVDNASHELRTPLTVITGYLEMLHENPDFPQQWHYPIEQSLLQANRMEKIINDMLKLSSIEHQRHLEDNDDEIAMPQLLNNLLNDVKNSSNAKEHHFSANIDSQLNLVGNQDEITSVVLNLLNNAVIHTQSDTEISIKWFQQDNKAHLWVCDRGLGIAPEHLTHLTERFYRVDNARDKNTNSTGLGLAIVKQICDNHQATLEIESEVGKDACFKICFPHFKTN